MHIYINRFCILRSYFAPLPLLPVTHLADLSICLSFPTDSLIFFIFLVFAPIVVPDWAVLSIFNWRFNSKRPPYCVHFLLDPSVFSFVTQSGSCYTRKCAATRVKTFQAPNKIKFFSHCSLFECPKEKKNRCKNHRKALPL